MDPRSSSFVLSLAYLLLFFSSTASAFNITRLLNQFPEFGAFNDYITKTKLFEQINTRQTITVLALDNATVSAIAGNSLDVVKEILSAHVILDYYDTQKLRKLTPGKPTTMTTMFQSTGDAMNQQGFIKVLLTKTGVVEFGSAAKGGVLNAKLVRAVASQPYNISVLQISAPIAVPGIGVYPSPPPPAPHVPVPAPVISPAPSADAPAPSADAPAPSDDDADSPAADASSPSPSPSEAEAPEAPVGSPPKPADSDASDDAEAPSPSAASRAAHHIIGAGVLMGLLSLSMTF